MTVYSAPKLGTRTQRRKIRQEIRNRLEPSSQPPPSLAASVNAARDMDELMRLTSGGALRVVVIDTRTNHRAEGESLVELLDAWRED